MRIMLHACCGPCLLEPYDALSATDEVTVVYANSNIQPREEYERRRDVVLGYAASRGIRVDELAYDPAAWDAAIGDAVCEGRERCRRCFAVRLEAAARHAAALGYDAVATTLTVSPYQDPEAIREAGVIACAAHGVRFLVTDFRERYPRAVARSRELGMYRQNYCGCRYSDDEAALAREERRERRRASGPKVS